MPTLTLPKLGDIQLAHIVGIIDTGINYLHPDLAANIWTNPVEIAGNGMDDDGNGYIDDIHGINAINNSGDPMDDHFHGSHTAGTIGAVGNNHDGVVGVNWTVSIVGCKFLDSNGEGSIANAVKCFEYFNYLRHVQGYNIQVTNNSWGGGGFSQAVYDAMAGLDQPGMNPILHAAAAGNDDRNNEVFTHYPSSYTLDNIISVAATDRNDEYASFSNWGATSVDLTAPGFSILSTVLGSGYGTYSGTSMATPHVAGAAALISSEYPNLTAVQMKQVVLGNLDDISGLGTNASKPTLTDGRLNVANVLNTLESDIIAPAAVDSLAAGPGGLLSIPVSWNDVGDDGLIGTAGSYDVRYSTSPIITEADWDNATLASGEPDPQTPGLLENFTITNLDHSTTYYIRLKVADQAFNESAMSNEVQASTQYATTVFFDDMEGGTNGWAAEGATGLWHQSLRRASTPNTAWYYGKELLGSYNTFATNEGTLTSPPIDLTSAHEVTLTFKEWSEVETVVLYDRTRVQISTNGSVWDETYESHGTSDVWADRSMDISQYAGSVIYLRFFFDTIDNIYNDFEGWYIDDVLVVGTGSNNPPVAVDDDTYNTDEDIELVIGATGVLGNDSDPDSDPVTAVLNVGTANGSLVLNPDGSFTYTPDADFNGVDNFTYHANDGSANSNVATVTITVNAVNDPPVASVDATAVVKGGTVETIVRANDTDVEDGVPSGIVAITTAPVNGSATVKADGAIEYIHNDSDTVSDNLSYTVKDSNGVPSNIATLNITVNAGNTAPVALDDAYDVDEDAGLVPLAMHSVLTNDSDVDNDPLSAYLVVDANFGTLSLNPDGFFTYDPDPDYNGPDSFTSDGLMDSNEATVEITVNPVNDAPVAVNDTPTVNEGDTVIVDVRANDTDMEDVTPSGVIVITAAPVNGTATVTGGKIEYIHDGSETDSDSLSYTVEDSGGMLSNVANVSISVNPVNDAPVAVNDAPSVDEGDTVLVDVRFNDTDMEDGKPSGAPSNGTATVTGGKIEYTHDGSETDSDSLSYTVEDSGGMLSNVATVSISVNPVNDAPVAETDGYSTDEDTILIVGLPGVLGNDNDSENDILSAVVVTGVSNGTLILNSVGSFTYDPALDFNGVDSFTYKANDGLADSNVVTVSITVIAVDDPPPPLVVTMHVHDIDAVSQKLSKGNWESWVTIYVYDSNVVPVKGATVTGSFYQDGDALALPLQPPCISDVLGGCKIRSGQFPSKSGKGKSFIVATVSPPDDYVSGDNHDDEGDSDGTTIQLSK